MSASAAMPDALHTTAFVFRVDARALRSGQLEAVYGEFYDPLSNSEVVLGTRELPDCVKKLILLLTPTLRIAGGVTPTRMKLLVNMVKGTQNGGIQCLRHFTTFIYNIMKRGKLSERNERSATLII